MARNLTLMKKDLVVARLSFAVLIVQRKVHAVGVIIMLSIEGGFL